MRRRMVGLRILNCAAVLVALGGCFDMLLPQVPANLLEYIQLTRENLSPEISRLILGLLKALGGCLIAVGIGSLLLINGPLKRGEKWALLPVMLLIGIAELINASQMWRFGSPFYAPVAFVILTAIGLAMIRPSLTISPAGQPRKS